MEELTAATPETIPTTSCSSAMATTDASHLNLEPEHATSLEVDTLGLDVDEVDKNVFLSGREVAQQDEVLRRLHITHILTVDSYPLDMRCYPDANRYTFLYISANDALNSDLLTHFPKAINFISQGQRVLVHCFVGMSRSATLVIAYLMHRYRLSYKQAFDRVKSRRALVCPNVSFRSQLKLFHKMNYVLDSRDQCYQQYVLEVITACRMRDQICGVPSGTVCRSDLADVTDPTISTSESSQIPPLDIKCRKCRTPISSSKQILHHSCGQTVSWWAELASDDQQCEPSTKPQNDPPCPRGIFILPSHTILKQCHRMHSKLTCPQCLSTLGRYSWVGTACDCSAKASPTFLLHRSKVDIPHDY